MTDTLNALKTLGSVKLEGIDAEGLERLSCNAKEDPTTGRRTVRARTVCEAGFRNMTYVRDLAPVLVGEPPALLGDDSAPNPSEMALAALGSCISVGVLANATHRGVTLSKIEISLEGDIDISAVWGVGDTDEDKVLGFTAVRASIALAGDTTDDELEAIGSHAMRWSPVVNTFANPVAVSHAVSVA